MVVIFWNVFFKNFNINYKIGEVELLNVIWNKMNEDLIV